jgi:hypothetical protein
VISQDQGLGQWIIRTMFARRAAVGEGSIAVRFVSEHLCRRTGFATTGG